MEQPPPARMYADLALTPHPPSPFPSHWQALIEGPLTGVPRQAFAYRRLVLTPFVLKKLPRAAGTSTVKKVFEASGVLDKWEKSAWAQRRKAIAARRATSDFDRFEIMLLKKQRRRLVQVSQQWGGPAWAARRVASRGGRTVGWERGADQCTRSYQVAEAKAKKSA